ncbi:hypothetical protein EVAR_83147_1 [Eumeta japonica]|uniref:Uncharacterized protein n=1 Tax=Eumeta variegata TaxID=151549 RepID=A0A4C1YDW4_EUMVA|nr:hypothetical protein EVAR_83147_1 [Eumeta japonica]
MRFIRFPKPLLHRNALQVRTLTMADEVLSDNQIIQLLLGEEISTTDSPDEDEEIQSDHNSESKKSVKGRTRNGIVKAVE